MNLELVIGGQNITNLLRESDMTFEMLVEMTGVQGERVLPALQSLMKYGVISRNEKVVMYSKADMLWFRIKKRSRK